MEQVLSNFIQEIFSSNDIPVHIVTLPSDDWAWMDLGLRSQILCFQNYSERADRWLRSFQPNTLYHLTDIFQCSYSAMRRPDHDSYVLIGPLLFEKIQDQRFEQLFAQLKLPETFRESLRSYYYNVKFIPYQSLYDNFMTLVANHLFGEGQYKIIHDDAGMLDAWYNEYKNYLRIPDQPFLNLQYIEERYQVESQIIHATIKGNETQAVEAVTKIQQLMMPRRLSNELRDNKDYCITLNTLLRKAAEQGGVHPIHIDSVSNGHIQQIEQLTSVDQCLLFRRKMTCTYCRLVQTCNLQDYSLLTRKVMTCVSTDLTADLSLRSLAAQLNVNASYLSSLFKKETGLSLTEYVNRSRIEHAQLLLITTDLPIKTIALQCGISDMYYFSRLFKRVSGLTAKAFRETATLENRQQMATPLIRSVIKRTSTTPEQQ